MKMVSVIVPVYNVEKYIEKCLKSLINQTIEELQIIIVNDGSTDSSKEKIQKYIKKYKQENGKKEIIYLEKQNGGLSDARNYGMKYATSKYIAFLDSDDYIENDTYQKMYKKIEEEKGDMVECDFIWEYPNKNKIDTGVIYKLDTIIKDIRVVAWNKLIKKEIIDKNKIEFPKGYRYEDVLFTYKLIPYLNKISFIKEPLIHYVQRENSISNNQTIKTKDIIYVLDRTLKYYKEKGIYEKYKEQLEYIYVRYMFCSSLKRMRRIKNRKIRKEYLKESFEKVYITFPNWKKNKYLKDKSLKNIYLKSINKTIFKLITLI